MSIKLNLTAKEAEMVHEALEFYMAENNSFQAHLIIDIQEKIEKEIEHSFLDIEASQ